MLIFKLWLGYSRSVFKLFVTTFSCPCYYFLLTVKKLFDRRSPRDFSFFLYHCFCSLYFIHYRFDCGSRSNLIKVFLRICFFAFIRLYWALIVPPLGDFKMPAGYYIVVVSPPLDGNSVRYRLLPWFLFLSINWISSNLCYSVRMDGFLSDKRLEKGMTFLSVNGRRPVVSSDCCWPYSRSILLLYTPSRAVLWQGLI